MPSDFTASSPDATKATLSGQPIQPLLDGSCYAHAAASAYIIICARIHGLQRELPSYEACVAIADYNHGKGGHVFQSILLLEKQFDCGVLCVNSCEPPEIPEVFRISVVVSMWTSSEGWTMVNNGELLDRPSGPIDGGHAVLVESYDLEKRWFLGKNSWAGQSGSHDRFKFRFHALHNFFLTKICFTPESISGKTANTYHPQLVRFKGVLNDCEIDCAYMDEVTAKYDSEFFCEPCKSQPPPLNWIGYEMNQYLAIKTNIHICVRTLVNTFVEISIYGSDTVRVVKQKISHAIGVMPKEFDLSFQGRILQDGPRIQLYKVVDGSTLLMVAKCYG
jgi:hypothetical protein